MVRYCVGIRIATSFTQQATYTSREIKHKTFLHNIYTLRSVLVTVGHAAHETCAIITDRLGVYSS